MSIFEGLTKEIGTAIIADVSSVIADALVEKGLITADQKANTIGSINFLGDIALQAYLKSKAG